MKTIWFFIKSLLENLFTLLLIVGGTYLFLALCNWDFNIGGWNGFSRVLGGFITGVFSYFTFDAMRMTVRKIRKGTFI